MGVPVATTPFRSCGSDDFSESSTVMPSLMSFIGTGAEGGIGLPHAQFLPRRAALRLAAVTLATNYIAAADTILTHHTP